MRVESPAKVHAEEESPQAAASGSESAARPLETEPQPQRSARRPPDPFTAAAGVLSAGLGVAVLTGWHFGIPVLLHVYPGFTPMAYNTAVTFALMGLALVAMAFGRRRPAQLLAGAAGLIAFARLLQYGAGYPREFETILSRFTLPAPPVDPVPMAPNTAWAFGLLAGAAWLGSLRREFRWKPTAIAFCGSGAAALGMNALLGYLTGVQTYMWSNLKPMAVHASAGLILLGVTLVAFSWRAHRHIRRDWRWWSLVVISVGGGITSVSFWAALSSVERLQIESAVRFRSGLPEMVLLFGFLVTALLGAAVYLAQTARLRTVTAERLRETAESEIAERKQVEAALEAERRRFSDVLDLLPAYVVLLTPDYHVPFANRFFRERFGESGGRRCFEYLFGRSEPCAVCESYNVLKTGSPHHWEWTGPDARNYDIYDFPFTEADGTGLILEVGIDITETKRATQEVRRANAYNRSLVEASLDPLVTIAPDGRITDVNRATEEVTACSRQELIGTDFSDYFTDPRKARDGYQQVFREGLVKDYELALRRRDGHVTPVLYNASVYRDESGQVLGVFAAARDITARKRAQEEIEARVRQQVAIAALSQRALAADLPALFDESVLLIAETLGVPYCKVLELEADGKALLLRSGVGWKEGLVGRATVGAGKDSQAGYTLFSSAPVIVEDLRQETRFSGPRLLHEHGVISGVSVAIPGSEHPFGVLGVHSAERRKFTQDDVHFMQTAANVLAAAVERAHAEREARRAATYNRSLIESSLDPLVTIAADGKITDVNRATELVTGCSRQELVGADFSDYFTDPEKARQGYQQVFREGSVQDYELLVRRRDGHLTPVLYNASVFRDEAGAVTGVFAAARDITDRKRAEEALEQKARDLARSNADLEQFAYVASHDLQEPLRMVANFTQLLADRYRNQLGEDGAEFIGYAVDGATRMQRLIQDLLTYSRVGTRGKNFEPTDCNEVLGAAVANLQVAIQENGAVVTHEELPTVMADASQMAQVFQNLVGNAIKFRGAAAPRVHVSAERQGSRWVFAVRDNGIGIDPAFADRIFVIFQRLHSRGEYPGTGIGLALSKKIVERHGGRIWVESQPGRGATFFFMVPAA